MGDVSRGRTMRTDDSVREKASSFSCTLTSALAEDPDLIPRRTRQIDMDLQAVVRERREVSRLLRKLRQTVELTVRHRT